MAASPTNANIWDTPWVSILLTPLSWLYAFGWWVYLGIYRGKIKQAYKCFLPVVCVGNLTVGGTGKTPTTIFVAQTLMAMGKRVVISCSGYGSKRAKEATLAPEGALDSLEWGDEAALIRALLPEVELIVGRDRVLAAQLAEKADRFDVVLMDDGFQHLRLHIDHSIVLDPEPDNTRTLPAGPYRESRGPGRERADRVLPDEELVIGRRSVWRDAELNEVPSPEPSPVNLLCAVGNPKRLRQEMDDCGFEIGDSTILRDHARFDKSVVQAICSSEVPTVVTAKDWVKLSRVQGMCPEKVLIRDYTVEIAPLEAFTQWLAARMEGTV